MQIPLRIGIEAQRLFRIRKNGMDVYALELIRALQALDKTNHYFIFAQPDEDATCLRETPNFKIITHRSFSYPLWEQWTLPKLVKKYNLDLLHCTATTAPIFPNTQLVVTLHDVFFMQKQGYEMRTKGDAYQQFGNKYRSWLLPLIAHKAKGIFTVSNYQKSEIAQLLHVSEPTVQVTYNGVSAQFFEPVDLGYLLQIQHKYHLPERFFFFLGNTEPRKNLTGVLKAYSLFVQQNPKVADVVITGVDRKYVEQKMAEENIAQIRPNVHLVPYLTTEELAAIYHLTDCFLFPSFSEGFGMPIIEAMACGAPVITSTTTSMPEIGGEAAMLVNPADTHELASAMAKIIHNPFLAERLRTAGKARAIHFSWRDTALQTLATYETILNRIPTLHSYTYAINQGE